MTTRAADAQTNGTAAESTDDLRAQNANQPAPGAETLDQGHEDFTLSEDTLSSIKDPVVRAIAARNLRLERENAAFRVAYLEAGDDEPTPAPQAKQRISRFAGLSEKGYEELAPVLSDYEANNDSKIEALEAELAQTKAALEQGRRQDQLEFFKSTHQDHEKYQDRMVEIAKSMGLKLSNASQLDRLYRLAKAEAMLPATQRELEAERKRGPIPRLTSTGTSAPALKLPARKGGLEGAFTAAYQEAERKFGGSGT